MSSSYDELQGEAMDAKDHPDNSHDYRNPPGRGVDEIVRDGSDPSGSSRFKNDPFVDLPMPTSTDRILKRNKQ